jgi:hypothetical protein
MDVISEVENLINSRPITWISADLDNQPSLTTNDILTPSTFLGPSLAGSYDDGDVILSKWWRQGQCVVDHFSQ